MDYEKEIINKIRDMSKYYSGHQVFRDWIEVYALTIANVCEPEGTVVWNKREQQYLNTINIRRQKWTVLWSLEGCLHWHLKKICRIS